MQAVGSAHPGKLGVELSRGGYADRRTAMERPEAAAISEQPPTGLPR
jgi:hypothetical protein